MFLVLLCISIGMQAQDPTWTDGTYSVTITNIDPNQVGGKNTYQKIEVNQAGALAAYLAAYSAAAPNDVKPHQRIDATRVNLQIEGPLNENDIAALKSANVSFKRPVEGQPGVEETVYPLASITSLDLKNATFETTVSMAGMSMENLKYLRLPSNFDTVGSMSSLSTTTNPNLEVALSTDAIGNAANKIVINSFKANGLNGAKSVFITNYENFLELNKVKYVTMSGIYGDHDLVDGTSKNFGNTPAVWDFTGATFVACDVDGTVANRGPYYASNDPFCEHGTVTPLSSTYPSNAFYYFRNYSTKVVDIKLPTGITELPPNCLDRLGEENGDNYKLVNNLTSESPEIIALEAEITATMTAMNKSYTSGTYYPIKQLVIPDKIETLGYECCVQSVIQNVMLGQNVKDVQGGAFKLNYLLEDLSCKQGINNCRLGDQAFNECNNMKHIQLSEGIVSLGNKCFNNSQHLESIRLPETLLYIGNLCFMDGHALSSITIPENVEKIGKQAFALTALKDIYLTTTDPAKVPVIYTAGKGFGDNDCTFSANEMYGNNSCPFGLSDTPEPANSGFGSMTWDDAVDWYYAHCNLIGVLHYPKELAAKVRADLSQQYAYRCEVTNDGGFGLPNQSQATTVRSSIDGTYNTTNDKGVYTSDGWAQFALMKEFVPNKDVVFVKEYDDVWYTMCFPFDLTDEQLAGAFNETFNIVDFSAVEIRDEEDGKKNLVLHFNNVAETVYKDEDNNIYVRKRDGAGGLTGNVIREADGKYDYNVYYKVENGTPNTSVEYHHFSQNTSTSVYKTKTFKAANSNDVLLIDGYLASAGHPYMIHPSTGTAAGSPKVRCYFSGISWKPEVDGGYDNLYNAQARTVDLGGAAYSGSTPETITYVTEGSKFTENNFDQSPYAGYAGQTYTFKGNWREVSADAPAKPTIENGKLEDYPPYPTLASHPDPEQYLGELYQYYPNGPTKAVQGPEPQPSDFFDLDEIGERMTENDKPETVKNPDEKTDDEGNLVYSEAFRTLYNTDRVTSDKTYTYGYDLCNYEWQEFFTYHNWDPVGYYYNTGSPAHWNNSCNPQALQNYLGVSEPLSDLTVFNQLKTLAQQYAQDIAAYNQYQTDKAHYDANVAAWAKYDAAWNKWNSFSDAQAEADYQAALTAYNTALGNWQGACDDVDDSNDDLISDWEDDCAAVDTRNAAKLADWEASVENYKVLIPQYAYFLARPSNSAYPKYYREMAPDNVARTTGRWTQYSAVIIPNAAALAGIEAGVDPNVQSGVKGYNIAFNEDYEGEFDPTEIKDIVAEAEEKGQKVEYMNIVYSINGEIISRGTSSLSGLPQGMYIINGKKYLVK